MEIALAVLMDDLCLDLAERSMPSLVCLHLLVTLDTFRAACEGLEAQCYSGSTLSVGGSSQCGMREWSSGKVPQRSVLSVEA